MEAVAKIPPSKRFYLDQTGLDNNETNPFAWGLKSERIFGLKKARRTQRLSIVAALNQKDIKAPFVFEGYCDTELMLTYTKEILTKDLRPGCTVIMDNASFHKSEKIRTLIEAAGCKLMFLPPYSPDFNPIEKKWFQIKNSMRKLISKYGGDLYRCADEVLGGRKTC